MALTSCIPWSTRTIRIIFLGGQAASSLCGPLLEEAGGFRLQVLPELARHRDVLAGAEPFEEQRFEPLVGLAGPGAAHEFAEALTDVAVALRPHLLVHEGFERLR